MCYKISRNCPHLCLANYVFCLQRGTGLSTPLTTTALAQFASPKQQAAYLRNFRADSIVKDAEIVRSYLVPDGDPWSVLGQVSNLSSKLDLTLYFLVFFLRTSFPGDR